MEQKMAKQRNEIVATGRNAIVGHTANLAITNRVSSLAQQLGNGNKQFSRSFAIETVCKAIEAQGNPDYTDEQKTLAGVVAAKVALNSTAVDDGTRAAFAAAAELGQLS